MNRTFATLTLLSAALLVTGCQKSTDQKLETTIAEKIDLRDAIKQTGSVRSLTSIALKSEASGRIQKIYVKEGSPVKKGEAILDIDPERLQINRERLLLDLETAKLTLAAADRKFSDATKLNATGNGTARSVDESKSERDLTAITVKQKELDLREVDKQLAKTHVVSPIDGVVSSLEVKEGEIAVSATESVSGGTPLATVSDLNHLEVVSQIGEADFVSVKEGNRVVIRPEAREGVEAIGRVSFVARSAKKESGSQLSTFEVRVAIDSSIEGVAPGVTVNVEFLLKEKKGVIGLPCEYVTVTPDDTFVLKPAKAGDKKGEPRKVTVSIGETDYAHYEIVKGVALGDTIIRASDVSTTLPPPSGSE